MYIIFGLKYLQKISKQVMHYGSVVKNPPANAGDARDAGSIPGLRRSPGVGNGNPLQYSCLENSMGIEPWATVHPVAKERDMTEHS